MSKLNSLFKQAKELLESGDEDDARELFYQEALANNANYNKAVEQFTKLFPASKELEKELKGSLADLSDDNPSSRKKAADYIERQARNDWTTKRRDWLADPRTMDYLIRALADNEAKVVEDVVLAIGSICQRFEYLDCRAHDALCDLYVKSDDRLKITIASSLPQFNTAKSWALIQNTLNCSPSKEAVYAVAQAAGYYAYIMPEDIKDRFVNEFLTVLKVEKDFEAKEAVLETLACMKAESVVEELKALLSGASKKLKAEIERTIEIIESDDDDSGW